MSYSWNPLALVYSVLSVNVPVVFLDILLKNPVMFGSSLSPIRLSHLHTSAHTSLLLLQNWSNHIDMHKNFMHTEDFACRDCPFLGLLKATFVYPSSIFIYPLWSKCPFCLWCHTITDSNSAVNLEPNLISNYSM